MNDQEVKQGKQTCHLREYTIAEVTAEAKEWAAGDNYGTWDHVGKNGDFCGVSSWDKACDLASHGWADGMGQAMAIADQVLPTIQADVPRYEWQGFHDVTGCEVDMDRYLTGIPENMIDYENVKISTAGRLITLVVSTCVSGAMSTEAIEERGAAIVALTLALQACQHEVEIWADFTTGDHPYSKSSERSEWSEKDRATKVVSTRILVKGAHDSIDDAVVAFWVGHPASSRAFGFLGHGMRPDKIAPLPSTLGYVHDAVDIGYPEHSLFIDSMISRDREKGSNADFVLGQLRALGIIE